MHTPIKARAFLIASLTILLFACTSDKKGKDTVNQSAETIESTSTSPAFKTLPDTSQQTLVQKCYTNDGLKYSTVITINYMPDNTITGKVTSKELDSDKKEGAKFTGTLTGDKLTVKFVGTPPLVGTASEWTSNPWTIVSKPGKESIGIVFNAKNYETNKWAETDYVFVLTDCK